MRGYFEYSSEKSDGDDSEEPNGSQDLELGKEQTQHEEKSNSWKQKQEKKRKMPLVRANSIKGGMNEAEWTQQDNLDKETNKLLSNATEKLLPSIEIYRQL